MPGQKRIGLDTRNSALLQGTGVATYATTLAKICGTIGLAPQLLTAEPMVNNLQRFGHAILPFKTLRPNFSAADIYRVAQEHFNFYRRPLKLRTRHPPGLMHWTYPLPLLLNGCPNVLTIHDLIPLLQPDLTGIDGGRLRRLLGSLIRQVDGIVTVSETVREQVIRNFGLPRAFVRNLYQAVDVTPFADGPAICPAGSFVVVGRVEPRKNIRRLIAAYAAAHVTAKLVIIGPDGYQAAGELGGIGANVIRIPYAGRDALLQAMATARAVLFPSLAEGFGLPMVEAFALGTPVMASRGSTLEEIAGGAALLVNPEDVDEMARSIRLLAQDDGLCARLSASGRIRSAFFSMDACAARLRSYYDEVMNSRAERPGTN